MPSPRSGMDQRFSAERLAHNLSRLWVAAWLGLVVHAIHVVVFLSTRPLTEPAEVAQWRTTIVGAHAVMIGVALLTAVAARAGTRFPRWAALAPPAFAVAYLLLGAVLTGADQVISSDTSPWVLVVLAVVLLVRVDVSTMVGALLLGFVAYLVGQGQMQPDAQVLLSNAAKGLSAVVVGLVLTTIFARSQRREFEQRQVIEQQRTELELALAEAHQAVLVAERANRAKSTFLATMGHEIRTPMTGVLGVADLLALTSLDANQRQLLQTVQDSGSTLVALISDLLDLSRAESGQLRVESLPLDVAREVAAVVRLFEPKARGKGLTLEVRWTGEPPPLLRGDPLRLRQVLSNLVGNALKFTAVGAVELRCRAQAGADGVTVVLEVADTGPGIAPESLARLFQPWAQADDGVVRRHGGSGLGLAISRQLAEAMAGKLEATSEVGRGSLFGLTLCLPRAAPGEVAAPLEAVAPPSGTPLSGRVLVADDNSVNQLVARGILRQMGLEVEVAADGAGAQTLLSQHAFDAVLTDLHMPGIGGLELLRWVRGKKGPLQHLPVLVLTADLSTTEREACLAGGANAVLSKPFRAAELEACLRAEVPTLSQGAASWRSLSG